MTITIGYWIIPAIITAVIVLWPWPKSQGSGGWFPDIWPAFVLMLRTVGVLFVWLLYFAIAYFLK